MVSYVFRSNPGAFAFLLTLMDHEQDRQKDDHGLYWKHSTDTVMQPLLDALNQAGYATTLDEVAQIVGITEVNNCEIYNPDGLTGIRGLFPVTSLMSHKCAGLLFLSYCFLYLLSILVVYQIVGLFSIMKNHIRVTAWLPKEFLQAKN